MSLCNMHVSKLIIYTLLINIGIYLYKIMLQWRNRSGVKGLSPSRNFSQATVLLRVRTPDDIYCILM